MNMNYQIPLEKLSNLVQTVSDISFLSDFVNKSYYGVIWDRQIPIKIQDWLNKTDPSLIPSFREICHKNEVSKKIINIFENSKLTNKKETEWLIQDITNLSEVFSDLMKVDYIRLKMEMVLLTRVENFM